MKFCSRRGPRPAQIEQYFAHAKDHVYDSLRPELRARLIRASVGMMAARGEAPETRTFAGENWGMTGVAHRRLSAFIERNTARAAGP